MLAAILWGSLLAAASIDSSPVRVIVAVPLVACAYFTAVFEDASGQRLNYSDFFNLLRGATGLPEARIQHRASLIRGAESAFLLLAVLVLPPGWPMPLADLCAAAAPIAAALVAAIVMLARNLNTINGAPPSLMPLIYLMLLGYDAARGALGARQAISLPHSGKRLSGSVVLIIDESVAGQYLDINASSGVPTPLSRHWPGLVIHNYGLAASITHCSFGTNLTLRYGGTRGDYHRINATGPSIWAYARKAGLQTVYMDAQLTDGPRALVMYGASREALDRFVQFPDVPVPQRDMALAEALIAELADPTPKLILVNKIGAHFPVHDKYPDDHMRYGPALPRGGYVDAPHRSARREGFGNSAEEWARYRNAYRNTLLWNVGTFFETVLSRADLSRATLLYTSDHGQNLRERGGAGGLTHCSPHPEPEEGTVPLVLIAGEGASDIDWERDLPGNRDRSSHYMIFPTLLVLMGYEAAAVEAAYGRGLHQPSDDPRTFNTVFSARFDMPRKWLAVDADLVQRPLDSDWRGAEDGPQDEGGLR
ncbi:sulfatase-like hydrolase/transferase [Ancylobacter aquaticus]|uniref:sulfatase-like hydrolase/transferase n=1 Tax=Ancylobacter aquaticus TaxID=100 RepID=UPI0014046CD2|nr:sulfatase-like hydrolase/transferase [Ancylobacter aquaticus]